MSSPDRLAPPRLAALLALPLLLPASVSARAAGQVAGPVQVGPSWGQGDPQHSAALLSTRIVNHGTIADRLIRVDCPAIGQVALRNGTLHSDIQASTTDQQRAALSREQNPNADHTRQNGLDLPPGLHDQAHPVTAQFDLTRATQPVTDGALVPCALYFAHAGERVVVFTIGEQPTPTDEP